MSTYRQKLPFFSFDVHFCNTTPLICPLKITKQNYNTKYCIGIYCQPALISPLADFQNKKKDTTERAQCMAATARRIRATKQSG